MLQTFSAMSFYFIRQSSLGRARIPLVAVRRSNSNFRRLRWRVRIEMGRQVLENGEDARGAAAHCVKHSYWEMWGGCGRTGEGKFLRGL